jgi:hypothetical protein
MARFAANRCHTPYPVPGRPREEFLFDLCAACADAPGVLARVAGRLISHPPESALLMTVRVGSLPVPIPPGYLLDECGECRHPVWLGPDLAAEVRRSGRRKVVRCTVCVPPPEVPTGR